MSTHSNGAEEWNFTRCWCHREFLRIKYRNFSTRVDSIFFSTMSSTMSTYQGPGTLLSLTVYSIRFTLWEYYPVGRSVFCEFSRQQQRILSTFDLHVSQLSAREPWKMSNFISQIQSQLQNPFNSQVGLKIGKAATKRREKHLKKMEISTIHCWCEDADFVVLTMWVDGWLTHRVEEW